MPLSDFDGATFWPAIKQFVIDMGVEEISLGEPEDESWPKIFEAMELNGTPLSFGMDQGQIMRTLTAALATGGWGPPNGFLFPFASYPISIRRSGPTYTTSFDPETYAAAALNGIPYYVDFVTGNNANTGLSPSQKLKSTHAAITKANSAGLPFHIIQTGGGAVPRSHGPTNTATVFPTQPCALIADGARVISGAFDDLTWTVNATYSNVYQASRTNVLRVIDMANNDSFGNYVELAMVADLATCAATENSWALVAGILYVNRADNAVVANANTRALLLVDNMKLTSVCKDFYVKGFDFLGGQGGTFQANGVVGNVIAEDCTMKFSGGPASLEDGVRLIDVRGLSAFVNCVSSANAKDGFNAHRGTGDPLTMFLLTINCIGRDNGRFTSQSNNFWTLHEDVVGIDVNGIGEDNYGCTFHIIDSSQAWAVGTQARRSKGDIVLGGGLAPQEFRTEGTSMMWLQDTIAETTNPANWALAARHTSSILKRRHTTVSGVEFADAGATIGRW